MHNFTQPAIVASSKGEFFSDTEVIGSVKDLWLVFAFDKNNSQSQLKDYFLRILSDNNSFNLSESENRFMLSGSVQTFLNYFNNLNKASGEDISILEILKNNFKNAFDNLNFSPDVVLADGITFYPSLEYTKEEKMKHWWAMVKIAGSQEMICDLAIQNRHASLRKNESNYNDFFGNNQYIIPPAIESANLNGDYKNKLNQIHSWYLDLQKMLHDSGKTASNRDAGAILPIAITSEIVMSCNLQSWREFFQSHCEGDTPWELRQISLEILFKFKQIFPGCFDDFEISPDGMSAVSKQ